jgi:regulator of cell morphogenesis and NO signaling
MNWICVVATAGEAVPSRGATHDEWQGTNVTTQNMADLVQEDLAATPIRELVERWPAVLRLLAPLGIDLCCGGAHPLGEALDLHGIARQPVLRQIAAAIEDTR